MDREQIADDDNELLDLLADYGKASMPRPDDGFYDKAVARAIQVGSKKQRTRWVMTGFGGAVAAMLAIWVVSGIFFVGPDAGEPGVPTVTMALEQPQTFNLVFASATALDNATMTVTLPEGIEVAGFGPQSEITWETSLQEGKNILPLTLVATRPVSGELLATLTHEEDYKTFRLQMTVI
jgi:hypothetical protein